MRAIPLLAAAVLTFGLTEAGAQPVTRSHNRVIASAASDDLSCAARYTLAAFAIQGLDATAAAYYAGRANDAGKRYLALHPGESEQSYTSRVTVTAQNLQQGLTNNAFSPEQLVSEIKTCDQASDSRIVT